LTEIVNERLESKDQEINELKEQMAKMNELVEELNHAISFYKPVFDGEMKRLNPHLNWST
jgi:tetrahydromethanopterin S-methyltransferase subunit B